MTMNEDDRTPGFFLPEGYDRELAKRSVESGWAALVDRAFDAVERVPGVRVVQVKPKMGELRVYVEGREDSAETRALQQFLIELRDESQRTCEVCGAPGTARGMELGFWTLCDRHAEERRRGAEREADREYEQDPERKAVAADIQRAAVDALELTQSEESGRISFELWDLETGNLHGYYGSIDEATRITREAVERDGEDALKGLALNSVRDDERTVIAESVEHWRQLLLYSALEQNDERRPVVRTHHEELLRRMRKGGGPA